MTIEMAAGRQIELPPARGPWTEALYQLLRRPTQEAVPPVIAAPEHHPLLDDDLELALYLCYELHYAGIDGVDDKMEWSPLVLMFRAALEAEFETAVLELIPCADDEPESVGDELQRLVREDEGPPLSRYAEREATREQLLEHVVHRSAYQLKEADPHSWAIPRLVAGPKAALVEIQADEYGGGMPGRMHAELFRTTMRWLGLDDEYGHYVPVVPAVTLAVSNLMSLFALNRRWLGALLGHLAALEMTSTWPNRQYSAAARRLGADQQARRYFDEHVEADAVHEQVAAHELCGGYAAQHPGAAADIMFGASCCLMIDDAFAGHLLSCWRAGQPSLRPLAAPQPVG
jgi:pyrroloquinoline quinone (PQQ) biosynthesis protein C